MEARLRFRLDSLPFNKKAKAARDVPTSYPLKKMRSMYDKCMYQSESDAMLTAVLCGRFEMEWIGRNS